MSDEAERQTTRLLAAIVALHFAVRMILFSDLQAGDDLVYSEHVQKLLTGSGFAPSSNFACRIGFIVALAAFRLMLGINSFALAAFNVVCSAGTTVVAFAVGKLLFNRGVGLLAAASSALFPLNVVYSTDARPDVPASFLMGLGLYFFLRARGRNRPLDYVLSGFWLFVAYLVKEVAVFAAVVITLWILAERRFGKACLLTAGTFLGGLVLEGVMYAAWTGDFLQRFHVIQAEQGGYARGYAATTEQVLHAVFLREPEMLFNPSGLGWPFVLFVPWVALGVGIWTFWKGRNLPEYGSLRTVVLWGLAIYLCLSFWPLKIYPYVPAMRLQMRMLEPLGLPMLVLFAYAVWRLCGVRLRLGSAAWAVSAVLFVGASWILYRDARRQTDGAALAYARVREELGERRDLPVYLDGRTRNLFLFWDRYQPRYDYIVFPEVPAERLSKGLVICNSALIDLAREDHPIPDYVQQPPPSWSASVYRLPGRIRIRSLWTNEGRSACDLRIYRIR